MRKLVKFNNSYNKYVYNVYRCPFCLDKLHEFSVNRVDSRFLCNYCSYVGTEITWIYSPITITIKMGIGFYFNYDIIKKG